LPIGPKWKIIIESQERKSTQFSIREKGDVSILDLVGEIRFTEQGCPTVHSQVKEQLAQGKRKILLNFEHIDFIDSCGIGDILAAYVSCQQKAGKLKIFHLPPKIWLVFNYSGLTRIIATFDTEEQALRSFD